MKMKIKQEVSQEPKLILLDIKLQNNEVNLEHCYSFLLVMQQKE